MEVRGDKNQETADKIAEALKIVLNKFRGVKMHRPRQMAELTLVGLDVSITREEVRTAVAREGG